jgi:hypothetical protein
VILAVPEDIATTEPEVLTVATEAFDVDQVPPEVVLYRDKVPAEHIAPVLPLIGATVVSGATVTTAVRIQPAGVTKLIVAVPSLIAVNKPVVEEIVATAVLVLLHVPAVPVVRPLIEPAQSAREPDISVGIGATVTVVVVEQPVPTV